MKTAFIGHRKILDTTIEERLKNTVIQEIESGCKYFTMGTHGDFDKLALKVCRNLRKKYTDIVIEVVLTSLHSINKVNDYIPYADVQTIMYAIDEIHYKQKITISNKHMLNSCSTLICYADESKQKNKLDFTAKKVNQMLTKSISNNQYCSKSGTATALHYAKKQGLNIINLYTKENDLFFQKSYQEFEIFFKTIMKKPK